MQKALLGARVILGLIFVLFGINYFVPFLPPPEPNAAGGAFLGALNDTGYMFPLIKLTEIVGGALVLTGYMVPLGLVLLAPVVVNIFLYHVVLDTAGLPMSLAVLALQIFVAWGYRGSFKGVLKVRAQPTK